MATTLETCVYISDFKEYSESLDISHDKLHLKARLSPNNNYNFIVNSTSIVTKYYSKILDNCRTITLTDAEMIKYKFHPKMFCYDNYGTTELWSLLLRVNNMISAMEFTKQKILVFDDTIFELLNDIMILEENNISFNKEYNGLI